MNIEEKLNEVLKETLHLDSSKINGDEKFNSLDIWDSMTFMFFISNIEDKFGIILSNEEILDMDCINKTRELIASKINLS